MNKLLEQLLQLSVEQGQRLARIEAHIQHLGYLRDHPSVQEESDELG